MTQPRFRLKPAPRCSAGWRAHQRCTRFFSGSGLWRPLRRGCGAQHTRVVASFLLSSSAGFVSVTAAARAVDRRSSPGWRFGLAQAAPRRGAGLVLHCTADPPQCGRRRPWPLVRLGALVLAAPTFAAQAAPRPTCSCCSAKALAAWAFQPPLRGEGTGFRRWARF